jgi:hypothetical protein
MLLGLKHCHTYDPIVCPVGRFLFSYRYHCHRTQCHTVKGNRYDCYSVGSIEGDL